MNAINVLRRHPQLALHTAVLLFGLSALIGKFLTLSPFFIVFFRASFGAALLFTRRKASGKSVSVATPDIPILVLLGVLLAVHWVTFFHSIQVSTVAVGLLSYASFPVFVTFLEPLFFDEPLKRRNIFTSLVVVLGLVLVVPTFDFSSNVTVGLLWGTVSAFAFAALSLINRKVGNRYDSDVTAGWQNLVAGLMLVPMVVFDWPTLTIADLGLLLALAVFCTAFAHSLYILALKFVTTRTASIVASLESVYGIVFAYVLLGEVPNGRMILGGAVIISAVVLSAATDVTKSKSSSQGQEQA